jgi:hypothetical protein
VAQWLVTTFGLTAEDARSEDNYALRWSCDKGHLAVAQWLVATFNLTAEDVRTVDCDTLQDHPDVYQWLTTAFG